jgi:hypothetical protein
MGATSKCVGQLGWFLVHREERNIPLQKMGRVVQPVSFLDA